MQSLPLAKPLSGSGIAGLIASLCCGGSLIFASMGLGAFYSTLGLARYIPQALAAGALSIISINYFYYRGVAKRAFSAGGVNPAHVRRTMFISAAAGLVVMSGSFVFLEWLNHAVVNAHRFLAHSQYGRALIPGVPNIRLIYALASFAALALLWALPFPQVTSPDSRSAYVLRWGPRSLVFLATAVTLAALVVDATR